MNRTLNLRLLKAVHAAATLLADPDAEVNEASRVESELHKALADAKVMRAGPWLVRYVEKGDPIGLPSNESVHRNLHPEIHFHDTRCPTNRTRLGYQFVSSYRAVTLVAVQPGRGLSLDFGVPSWTVEPDDMDAIREFVATWLGLSGVEA